MKNKLQKGDLLMVIAPAESLKKITPLLSIIEKRLLDDVGVDILYGKNVMESNSFGSSEIKSRTKDLHAAFKNKKVKGVIAATGGYNSNDLLDYIDWDLIKQNPKPIIGSSDITVLLNAIYSKTGIVTYYGPSVFKFGMKHGLEYTIEYFRKCLFSDEPYSIAPSKKWSNDKWYRNQEDRIFFENTGPVIIHPGSAQGRIVGGNLCSFNLLQGTKYMPSLKGSILFIEDDDLAGPNSFGEFSRNLQSILQLPDAKYIKGIVVGRFQKSSCITLDKIKFIFDSKIELKKIPIIANVDFGHTDPMTTFPIGGITRISTKKNTSNIKILKH